MPKPQRPRVVPLFRISRASPRLISFLGRKALSGFYAGLQRAAPVCDLNFRAIVRLWSAYRDQLPRPVRRQLETHMGKKAFDYFLKNNRGTSLVRHSRPLAYRLAAAAYGFVRRQARQQTRADGAAATLLTEMTALGSKFFRFAMLLPARCLIEYVSQPAKECSLCQKNSYPPERVCPDCGGVCCPVHCACVT